MLHRDLGRCQGDIVPDHLKSAVSKDLLKREHIPAIYEIVSSEGMAAEVDMQSLDA